MNMIELMGFHGTDIISAKSIQNKGFTISKGDEHWLGDGAYFFVKGLCDPQTAAVKWAIVNAWDKKVRRNRYPTYAVLQVSITSEEERILDLREQSGVEILEYVRRQCQRKLERLAQRKCRVGYIDGLLINFARKEVLPELTLTISNLFIKLTKEERIQGENRRTQNCTVCAVYTPQNSVSQVKVIQTGKVVI